MAPQKGFMFSKIKKKTFASLVEIFNFQFLRRKNKSFAFNYNLAPSPFYGILITERVLSSKMYSTVFIKKNTCIKLN